MVEKVHMAELYQTFGEYVSRCHLDRFVVITHHCVLWLRKELLHGKIIFAQYQNVNRDIVRGVVDAVDERSLLIITLHLHVLAVYNQYSLEPRVVPRYHVVIVR